MPIFLYFICGTPATAWHAKRCHVHTQDLNWQTPRCQSGTCELNCCSPGPATRVLFFVPITSTILSFQKRWSETENEVKKSALEQETLSKALPPAAVRTQHHQLFKANQVLYPSLDMRELFPAGSRGQDSKIQPPKAKHRLVGRCRPARPNTLPPLPKTRTHALPSLPKTPDKNPYIFSLQGGGSGF